MPARTWKRTLLYWTPTLLWVLAMNLFSRLWISQGVPDWVGSNDKLMHAVYFGGFALCVFYGGLGSTRWSPWAVACAAVVLTALYGGFDEWMQSFDPYRMSDRQDWLADVAGACVVFPLVALLQGWRRFRPPPPEPALET